MNFEFATANRIIFGAGRLKELGPVALEMGRRALVVVGLPIPKAQPLLEQLRRAGLFSITYPIAGEPTTDEISRVTLLAREEHCEVVVGLGGGSAMDTAKAVAALVANGGEISDYLEVIGKGKSLARQSLPCIAVPTTAGTGSEVTRNAVIGSVEQGVKVSLRSPNLFPRLALVDPELTYDLPPEITASTGLDALTQLIEPFVSVRANPLTDSLCREGIRGAARSLRQAYDRGNQVEARADLSLASLLSGLALANAGLGAVHGFASVIGGMYHAPHGAICARLLPLVLEANQKALQERHPDSVALTRYDEIAQLLTGNSAASARDGITWIDELCVHMKIPSLGSYGVVQDHLPAIIQKSTSASSMKGNPIQLTRDEMGDILERAL